MLAQLFILPLYEVLVDVVSVGQLIGALLQPFSCFVEPLHLLVIVPDLAVDLVALIVIEAEAVHLVSVGALHEELLVLDVEGELVLEADEGVVDLGVVDAFVVLLVFELHALEGFVQLVLVGEVEDLVVELARLALLQFGLTLYWREELLVVGHFMWRLLVWPILFVSVVSVEESLLVKPVNFLLIILWV